LVCAEYVLGNWQTRAKSRVLKNLHGNMDPIANMFTTIRNGYASSKESVVVPHSKQKMEILKLLIKEGYIKGASKRGKKIKKSIEVFLQYDDKGNQGILKIRRISKPSRRVYVSYKDIFSVGRGHGKVILSTPKGVITGSDARKQKVGGELVGEIW